MNLLVIGGGGREHAIAWKLAGESAVARVFMAPGNPGMAWDKKIEVTGIGAGDFEKIAAFAKEKAVRLVVVGPDQALADGVVNFLEARGIAAFGPSREASRIEWSKAYSKGLMKAAGIPTAAYEVFSELAPAQAFLQGVEWGSGWVVKADGLALGKGVVVCENREVALATVEEFFSGKMGDAGKTIVVEERLPGREVSAFFLCDGERGAPLGMACDYKRIFDHDQGPNTGGMGAFTPAHWAPAGFMDTVSRQVTQPLLAEMRRQKNTFKGVLFVGLMVNEHGEGKVLEFNARFGDPETQALMPMIGEDLLPWLRASRDGKLDSLSRTGVKMRAGCGVHVVSAAAGYPGTPRKGDPIELDAALAVGSHSWEEDSVKLFFAGVAAHSDGLSTNGGRVLGVTALAASLEEAREKAYRWSKKVSFSGLQRRSDIGR